MRGKASAVIASAMIGALVLGVCTANVTWIIAGLIAGTIIGLVIVLGQAQLERARKTGLDE